MSGVNNWTTPGVNGQGPLELEFISASDPTRTAKLVTFSSYEFKRSLLSPAAPFRFTAPGVNADVRNSIRSGDTVQLFAYDGNGTRWPIALGIIDETDTHISDTVDYTISGRDILGQLVDNASVNAKNTLIYWKEASLRTICGSLVANTRVPQGFTFNQVPTGNYLFNSNAGETKMSALQRMLEWANLLVWSSPDGQMIIGKPNFTQQTSGILAMQIAGANAGFIENNILECSVRRNVNQAIRVIITQLQDLNQVNPAQTPTLSVLNQDDDVKLLRARNVGRSVYETFDYGGGADTLNLISKVGNQSADYNTIGQAFSRRKIALENVKVLDVEAIVRDHVNSNGGIYNIDQMYATIIDDEKISQPLYVYECAYEMTEQSGCTTRLKLCKENTIVDGAKAI